MDIESSEVKELYEKLVDYSDPLYPLGSVYNSYKTTFNNIKEALLSKSFNNKYFTQIDQLNDDQRYATCEELKNNDLPEMIKDFSENCTDPTNIVVTNANIKDELIKLIGKEQEKQFKYVDFSPTLSTDCVYDNGYTCYTVEGGGTVPIQSFKEIKKVQKDEKDNIYIYDNYILLSGDENDDSEWVVYNTYDAKVKINSMSYEETPETLKAYISKYGDKDINTFKHTFKKDSVGNYYWYSTEIVEK